MEEWKKYGVCSCGYKAIAPFGDLFHIHLDVCPNCGEDKYRWDVVTGKHTWIKNEHRKWFNPTTWGGETIFETK